MIIKRRIRSGSFYCACLAILVLLFTLGGSTGYSQVQRVLGLDVSAWQGDITQSTWNNIRNVENRQFVFIRSSRGGTTGEDRRAGGWPSTNNTYYSLSQRYDDPYFVQNVNRASTAGMLVGSYHFSRLDVIETTPNSGGIRNSGTNEAHHFVQMAGAWMRPGYLLPVHDLEAGGDGQRTTNEIAQFCIDFSDFVYQQTGIRPAIYINGKYSEILQVAPASMRHLLARPAANVPSVVSPAYSTVWIARWPNQSNPNAIDVQNAEPKDSFTPIYGPWDDYGTTHPWQIWQYASTVRLQSYKNGTANLDFDVARGGMELLKDQLVPAIWWNDLSGEWTTLTNWNSGQTPVAPVLLTNQLTPFATGPMPVVRLPSTNDTVILERPNADITITLSSGTQNIRKLYVRETLAITGGTLNVSYVPSSDSTPIAAQFSAPVSLGGTATLNVHTLQVDTNRTFTADAGTLKFSRINLMPGSTSATLSVIGNITLQAQSGTNSIANGTGAGTSGRIDLGGAVRTLTVSGNSDVSIEVPIENGGIQKSGNGTLRVSEANTFSDGTTVSAGELFVNNMSGSGTGSGSVTVNGGTLGGTGFISGATTINSTATLAPGTDTTTGTLTFTTAPVLNGTNLFKVDRNDGSPLSDTLARTGGALNLGGRLSVTNMGSPLTGGEEFTILAATSYTGAFTSTNLPSLDAGLNWYMGNLGINGTIKVNRKPVVSGSTVTNLPGQTLQIAKASLVGSSSDDDGDTLSLTDFSATSTNGVVLSSDANYIYYSNPANVADEFSYTISDGRGGTETGTVTIASNPSSAPAISSGPQSATVIVGQTAVFSVTATGTHPLVYQWRKNGVSISDGGKISGATTPALSISNVAVSDAADYSVVITNTIGTATSSAATLTVHYSITLSVNGPGSVSKDPNQSSFAPGQTVTLTATEDTNAVFVSWTGDETSFENPLTVTMDSNKTIVGNFTGVGSVPDIIIDNNDPGLTLVGIWQTGTSATDKYGSDYRFASTAPTGTSNATYRPLISTPGNYDVYIWYPQGTARATNAPWTIVYNGGSTNVSVNQTGNGGKWNLIASARPFAVGTNGHVILSNNVPSGRVVMADAVKFAYSPIQGQAPIITSQPQSQTVTQGQNATFSVTVVGDPPSYQWLFNGENIPGAIASSYTRTNCQAVDAGTYSVVITNAAGSATSSGATLTVNVPASITTQPEGRTVVAGSNVVFSVTASGTAPLAYQWSFNGSSIANATTSTYTVANAQSVDAGNYSVVVTNAYGSAISADAALVVNVPAFITIQPQPQSIVQNNNATFSVVAGGTTPLNYQWSFNGTPVAGATQSSYTRLSVQTSDSGNYSVVVTNIAGSVTSANAALTVNVPASITAHPTNLTVIQGSNAVFVVVAAGTGPISYQWRFNATPLSGATSSTYTVANAQSSDAGLYSVLVTNAYGSATSANATLAVIVPPMIVTQPQSQTVTENDSVTLSISVSGTAPIQYQWRFNDVDILDATDSEYTIGNVQLTDAGNFSVLVSNGGGTATSSNAQLTVQPNIIPPAIVSQPTNVFVNAGASATFSVFATGTSVNYQWSYNGSELAGATDSSYTRLNVQTFHNGNYYVIISNASGVVVSSNATLTVNTDFIAPVVNISAPLSAQRLTENVNVTNYITSLRGTASDNVKVSEIRYSVNNGPWLVAAGTTNWSANISVQPGLNTVTVKAIDQGLNEKAASRSFTYVVMSPITVQKIGVGTISSNWTTPTLELGKSYKLTATVGAGTNFIFTNWTQVVAGSTNHYSLTNILTFTMQSNLVLQGNFITNPFVRLAGGYNGLFYQSNGVSHDSAGFCNLLVTKSRTFTGKLLLDGDSVSIAGKFNLEGTASNMVSRELFAKSPLTLELAIDMAGSSDQIIGTVKNGALWTAELLADRATWSTANQATRYTNTYAFVLPGFTNLSEGPVGSSYGSVIVDTLGRARLIGFTSDGQPANQSMTISKNGEWPLHANNSVITNVITYRGKLRTNREYQGSLMGWVTFATNTPAGRTNLAPLGTVSWIKTGWTNALYPNGFTNVGALVSSRHRYTNVAQQRVMNFTNASIILSGGTLPQPITNTVFLRTNNVFTVTATTNNIKPTLTATTGVIGGTYENPPGTFKQPFKGILLQDYNVGYGFFTNTTVGGAVTIQPQ